jgi:hypothetical protein
VKRVALRKTLRRSTLLLSLAAALACAHRNPPPDFAYDHTASFAGPKTYAWFEDPKWVMPSGNSIVDSQFVDRSVREAVNACLKKDGYVLVAAGDANFFVAYHEAAAGGLSQDKSGVYSSQSGSYVAPESVGAEPKGDPDIGISLPPPTDNYTGTKFEKRSTLVLDIRDSQKKLIWRRERTASIGNNPDELKKNIDHAVALLLAKFPPKTGTEAK